MDYCYSLSMSDTTKYQKLRPCIGCGKEYYPSSSGQKQCDKCRIKNCPICGKKFKTFRCYEKRMTGNYCGQACYLESRWGKRKSCLECSGAIGKGNKFCSRRCLADFHNRAQYPAKMAALWKRKMAVISGLGGKCRSCGISDIRVLDINHLDRSKKETRKDRQYITSRRLKDWEKNKTNIELLCANCHRIHTWKQMGYGKYFKCAVNNLKAAEVAKTDGLLI